MTLHETNWGGPNHQTESLKFPSNHHLGESWKKAIVHSVLPSLCATHVEPSCLKIKKAKKV